MTDNSFAGTASISAMDFRKQPGTVLDRVFYGGESVIIKKSDEPRAVLVSLGEFEQIQRIKAEAKKRLFTQIDKMRKSASSQKPEKIEEIIKEAVTKTKNASFS